MITCASARARLTTYIDADLDDATQSAVRGHLRTCAACRLCAHDEAAIRDGLHALPPPVPPPALWDAIQRGMATAEVADSKRSTAARWWQRLVAARPAWPTMVGAGAALAAVIAVLVMRQGSGPSMSSPATVARVALPPPQVEVASPPVPAVPAVPASPDNVVDVEIELAGINGSVEGRYQAEVGNLLAMVASDRAAWSVRQQSSFDGELAALQQAVTAAQAGRPREKAWRAVLALVQRSLVAPQVAELSQ